MDESFEFKPRPDLCFENKKCAESLFVEVIRPKEKNIVLGVVYRPPKINLRDFIPLWLNCLLKTKYVMLWLTGI